MSDLKLVSFAAPKPKTASKFKPGDSVYLKSDLVERTVRWADKDGVTCEWVTDLGEPVQATYLEEMLRHKPKAKPKRRPIRR